MKNLTRNKILLLFLFIVLSVSIYAYSGLTNFKPKYGTLTENVNFRSKASTSSSKIRTLKRGTNIKMVGTINNFYIIQLSSNEIGLVSKDYVKETKTAPKGAATYTTIDKKDAYTNVDYVTLRGGPSTSFRKIASLKKNTNLKIIGYINDWYIVVTQTDTVGAIRKDLLTIKNSSNMTYFNEFEISKEEKMILDLINKARKDNEQDALKTDKNLFKIARLKSQDMVKNSYFSHTSPKYGSPFKMMKDYDITYKVAGENIAGNPDIDSAVKAWLNSNTHKKNILSTSYNYIGIGVNKSDTYGYIIDVMFIGK